MSSWRFGNGSFIVSDEPTGCDDADNVRAYGGHLVCESVSPVHGNLIAAAPETLAERDRLRELLELVMSWVDNWSPNFTEDPEWQADSVKIRAAITKSKGGQP